MTIELARSHFKTQICPKNVRNTLIPPPTKSPHQVTESPCPELFLLMFYLHYHLSPSEEGHGQMVTWCLAAPASTRWQPEGAEEQFSETWTSSSGTASFSATFLSRAILVPSTILLIKAALQTDRQMLFKCTGWRLPCLNMPAKMCVLSGNSCLACFHSGP